MDTVLIRAFPYQEVPVPEQLLVLKVPQSRIDADLRFLQEKDLQIVSVPGPVEPGDVIRITWPDAEAEDGRLEAQFSVGKHYFDAALEQAVLGMCCGETREMPLQGKTVPVSLESVKRREIPPLAGDSFRRLNLEGVSNREEYVQYLVNKAGQKMRLKRDGIVLQYVQDQVLERSEFAPIDHAGPDYTAIYQVLAPMFTETPDPAMLHQMLGLPADAPDEAVTDKIGENVEQQVKLAALGKCCAERDGYSVSLDQCREELSYMLPNAAELRGTPAEEPYLRYQEATDYIRYYSEQIIQYYAERYTLQVG